MLITPEVKAINVNGKVELKWKVTNPFKYSKAPTIINNKGDIVFPYLQKYFLNSKRTTLEGKFASAFRARTKPLEDNIANRLIKDFKLYYKSTKPSDKIYNYTDALPKSPPKIDTNRLKTYKKLKSVKAIKC